MIGAPNRTHRHLVHSYDPLHSHTIHSQCCNKLHNQLNFCYIFHPTQVHISLMFERVGSNLNLLKIEKHMIENKEKIYFLNLELKDQIKYYSISKYLELLGNYCINSDTVV